MDFCVDIDDGTNFSKDVFDCSRRSCTVGGELHSVCEAIALDSGHEPIRCVFIQYHSVARLAPTNIPVPAEILVNFTYPSSTELGCKSLAGFFGSYVCSPR